MYNGALGDADEEVHELNGEDVGELVQNEGEEGEVSHNDDNSANNEATGEFSVVIVITVAGMLLLLLQGVRGAVNSREGDCESAHNVGEVVGKIQAVLGVGAEALQGEAVHNIDEHDEGGHESDVFVVHTEEHVDERLLEDLHKFPVVAFACVRTVQEPVFEHHALAFQLVGVLLDFVEQQ